MNTLTEWFSNGLVAPPVAGQSGRGRQVAKVGADAISAILTSPLHFLADLSTLGDTYEKPEIRTGAGLNVARDLALPGVMRAGGKIVKATPLYKTAEEAVKGSKAYQTAGKAVAKGQRVVQATAEEVAAKGQEIYQAAEGTVAKGRKLYRAGKVIGTPPARIKTSPYAGKPSISDEARRVSPEPKRGLSTDTITGAGKLHPKPQTIFNLKGVAQDDPIDPIEFARKYIDLTNHSTKGTGKAKRAGVIDAPVSKLQQKLARAHHIDLRSDAPRQIDNFAILHVEKKHGLSSGAAKRGEVPITPEDYAYLHDVLSNPDRVVYFAPGNASAPAKFGLLKRINGHILYIEEVRSSRTGTLALTSMRKWPATSDPPEGFLGDYSGTS